MFFAESPAPDAGNFFPGADKKTTAAGCATVVGVDPEGHDPTTFGL